MYSLQNRQVNLNTFFFLEDSVPTIIVLKLTGIPSGNNKFEEAKRKRDERKLARQRQMEAKRAIKLRTNTINKKL